MKKEAAKILEMAQIRYDSFEFLRKGLSVDAYLGARCDEITQDKEQ